MHLCAERSYHNGLARFLENHDEPRSAATFGLDRLPAFATLVGTLPGMRFYHQGQFEGRRLRPPVQLRAVAPETPNEGLRAFYEKILQITDAPIFHEGEWQLLEVSPAGDTSFENLIAYRWRSTAAVRLVVVNLGGCTAQGHVSQAGEVDPSCQYAFTDLLHNAAYEWEGAQLEQQGLFVRLLGHQAHIFDVKKR